MRYTYFRIKNFKGIEDAQLDLASPPSGKVFTLVGLNESGKTTLLEAIDSWAYREGVATFGASGYRKPDPHDLIPITKRANFNGSIEIEAGVELDQEDLRALASQLWSEHKIRLASFDSPFLIRQRQVFEQSRLLAEQPKTVWDIEIKAAGQHQRLSASPGNDVWQKIVSATKAHLPRVVYFPNFLFEFPDSIYLDTAPEFEERHSFYRAVLQDVLDSVGDGIDLTTHVLERAKSGTSPDKRSLESVLLRLSSHISKTVFGNWEKVFKRSAGAKEVVVDLERDVQGLWYLRLRIKEGTDLYEISERSLGFRWFFAYLLLTHYRGFRERGPRSVVFLLDEPASNLHPAAQTQLLESLQALPENCTVIYTTHSQHLINPIWLENAYVVRNSAVTYDASDDEATSRRTVISLLRYRTFVAKFPNQTTYFRPILDVLDYRPSNLELVPDATFVEGKNDFYGLAYARLAVAPSPTTVLIPGGGAGSLDSAIGLYLGWARNFIVLLDSDAEGESQRKRYLEKFGALVENRIFSLADINPTWRGRGIERLFSSEDLAAIMNGFVVGQKKVTKIQIWRAIQERVATRNVTQLQPSSSSSFRELFRFLSERLESAREPTVRALSAR